VHIAMMGEEVVRRRHGWSHEHFDLVGAANLPPGPNSANDHAYRTRRAGWKGLLLAGCCFLLFRGYYHLRLGIPARPDYRKYNLSFMASSRLLLPAVIVVTMVALGRKALKSQFSWDYRYCFSYCSFSRLQ